MQSVKRLESLFVHKRRNWSILTQKGLPRTHFCGSREIACQKRDHDICCQLGGRIGSGGLRGLQTRWGAFNVSGGFDSHPLPPDQDQYPQTAANTLVIDFLKSRRQGLSPRSIEYYRTYLKLAQEVGEVGIYSDGEEVHQECEV